MKLLVILALLSCLFAIGYGVLLANTVWPLLVGVLCLFGLVVMETRKLKR